MNAGAGPEELTDMVTATYRLGLSAVKVELRPPDSLGYFLRDTYLQILPCAIDAITLLAAIQIICFWEHLRITAEIWFQRDALKGKSQTLRYA